MTTPAHPIYTIKTPYAMRYYVVVCVLTLFAFFTPQMLDMASASGGMTTYTYGQGFGCSGGSSTGQLYTGAGGCAGDPSNGQVFSYFVCKFEEIIQKALGDVYCSIVEDAKPGVMAALTMAVLFFGMMFLMGVSPFTAKELMIFAAKFSMVLAFATQAEYMIGIGYALFMNFAKEGIIIVLNYLFEGGYSNSNDVYRMFDDALKEMMSLASQDSKKEGGQCKNALFSMMVLVAAALPPMAMIGMYFMIKLVWVMLRAVFGYCQGILGVTFLITLSPIYVSFALFKPTRSLFDKWIQYLISFSFQMVVVFAFLGMAFNIIKKMADDVQDYTQLVKPYNREVELGAGSRTMFNMCGVCEMDKVGPKEKPRCKSEKVMEIGQLSQDENFMHFASVKVIAMVIMFYILDIMMDFVPQMARHLAGQKYAAQLGGGDTGSSPGQKSDWDVSLPGEQNIQNALRSGAQAFMGAGNSASGFVRGLGAAGSTFMRDAMSDIGGMAAGAAGAVGAYSVLRGSSANAGTGNSGAVPDRGGSGSDGSVGGGGAPDRRSDAGDDKETKTFARADTVGNAARNERGTSSDGTGGDDAASTRAAAAAGGQRTTTASAGMGANAVSQMLVQHLVASRPAQPAKPTPVVNKETGLEEGGVQTAAYDPDDYDVLGSLQLAIAQYGGSVDPATLNAAMQDAALDPTLSSREVAAIRAYLNNFGQVGGGSGVIDA